MEGFIDDGSIVPVEPAAIDPVSEPDPDPIDEQQTQGQQQPAELIDGVFPDASAKEWAQKGFQAAYAKFQEEAARHQAEAARASHEQHTPHVDPAEEAKKIFLSRISEHKARMKGSGLPPEQMLDNLLHVVFNEAVQVASAVALDQVNNTIVPRIDEGHYKRDFFANNPDLRPYQEDIVDLVENHNVPLEKALKLIRSSQVGTAKNIVAIAKDNPHFRAFQEDPGARVAEPDADKKSLADQIVLAYRNNKAGQVKTLIRKWKSAAV